MLRNPNALATRLYTLLALAAPATSLAGDNLWPDDDRVQTDWWVGHFDPTAPADATLRRALLAGAPASGTADEGALICACHGVGEGRLRAAIADGCDSVEALGQRTAAGTGCGSCRPELRGLLSDCRTRPERHPGPAAVAADLAARG